MGRHFTNYTPEAMCALGQRIADTAARRAEFLENLRLEVRELLSGYAQTRLEVAAEIKAASDAWHSRYCHAARVPLRQSSSK